MSASYLSKDGQDRSTAPLGALRRFMREREQARVPLEHCELCSAMIAANHYHLLDLSTARCSVRVKLAQCSSVGRELGVGSID